MPTLGNYLLLSAILFAIGTAGVFVRRNLITILLSIEIMLNAVNLTFVAFGRALGSADGQIIVFFVMTVAAAEAPADDAGCSPAAQRCTSLRLSFCVPSVRGSVAPGQIAVLHTRW